MPGKLRRLYLGAEYCSGFGFSNVVNENLRVINLKEGLFKVDPQNVCKTLFALSLMGI